MRRAWRDQTAVCIARGNDGPGGRFRLTAGAVARRAVVVAASIAPLEVTVQPAVSLSCEIRPYLTETRHWLGDAESHSLPPRLGTSPAAAAHRAHDPANCLRAAKRPEPGAFRRASADRRAGPGNRDTSAGATCVPRPRRVGIVLRQALAATGTGQNPRRRSRSRRAEATAVGSNGPVNPRSGGNDPSALLRATQDGDRGSAAGRLLPRWRLDDWRPRHRRQRLPLPCRQRSPHGALGRLQARTRAPIS